MHGPWEHQGLREHNAHYDTRDLAAAQRVRRRGDDEPARARGADRRGASLAGRPHEPGLRAPRRVVEQRTARAGGVRRPDRGRRHDAARVAVAAVRGAALRGRGDDAARGARRRSRGSSTSRSRTRGARAPSTSTAMPKPAYYGVARAYRGAPSAQFATCGVGRARARRVRVSTAPRAASSTSTARVVAEADGGEVAAPLDAFAHDVFLLDLEGRNRYVMTRTENLAPLLDLPPATRRARRRRVPAQRRRGRGARRRARGRDVERRWVVFSDNVLDLLPGEERRSARRAAARCAWRAGMLASRALAPDGSPVDGFALRRALTVTLRRRRARRRGHPRRARAAADRRPAMARAGRLLRREPPEALHAHLSRASRPARVDVARMESDAWSFRADRCATPAVFARGGGLRHDASVARSASRASASPTATAAR